MGRCRLRRGDVVLIAAGKPRPAVIVQDDRFETPSDVLICPFTSTLIDAPIYRLQVNPTPENGLQVASQAMIDKIGPAARTMIGRVIGRLTDDEMARLTQAVATIIGLAD